MPGWFSQQGLTPLPQRSAGGHWLAVCIPGYVGSGTLRGLCFMLVSVSLIIEDGIYFSLWCFLSHFIVLGAFKERVEKLLSHHTMVVWMLRDFVYTFGGLLVL